MSARRRQETLEQFCIPLEDEASPTPSAPTSAPSTDPNPATPAALPRRLSDLRYLLSVIVAAVDSSSSARPALGVRTLESTGEQWSAAAEKMAWMPLELPHSAVRTVCTK